MTTLAMICIPIVAILYLLFCAIAQYTEDDSGDLAGGKKVDRDDKAFTTLIALKILTETCIAVGGLALVLCSLMDYGDLGKTIRRIAGIHLGIGDGNAIVIFSTAAVVFVAMGYRRSILKLLVERLKAALK